MRVVSSEAEVVIPIQLARPQFDMRSGVVRHVGSIAFLVRFIAGGLRLGFGPALLALPFRGWLECHGHLRLATMAWFKAGAT